MFHEVVVKTRSQPEVSFKVRPHKLSRRDVYNAVMCTILAASVLSTTPTESWALNPGTADPGAPDQFTWLAKARDPKALEWAAEQSEKTMERLTSSPEYPKIVAEIQEARSASSPTPSFYLLEDKIVRFVRNNEHKAGAFYVAPRSAFADRARAGRGRS
ncbi:hypothetical protein [Sphingopyxis lindanitolerans]|uniref:hypothetical protein n=1 Tax=Sphingopyxis lindanitolerans TaxID=2054227 RepID=UPI0011B229AD|nr:hypothetical protein [Sphingopyxis lindanitolerans]